jgi:hypothetical protein
MRGEQELIEVKRRRNKWVLGSDCKYQIRMRGLAAEMLLSNPAFLLCCAKPTPNNISAL